MFALVVQLSAIAHPAAARGSFNNISCRIDPVLKHLTNIISQVYGVISLLTGKVKLIFLVFYIDIHKNIFIFV